MNSPLLRHDIDNAFAALRGDESRAHRELVTLLYSGLEHWRDARGPNDDTLLIAAARQGHDSTVDMLLKKGFDALAWNRQLETALHVARTPITADLLMRASRNELALTADINEDLPLHVHLRQGHQAIVDTLLKAPNAFAQVVRPNQLGETALFEAARHEPRLVLPLLLQGCDPRTPNREGERPGDVTTDARTARVLRAFSAHHDHCDQAAQEQAMRASNATLAKRAREFLNSQPLALRPA